MLNEWARKKGKKQRWKGIPLEFCLSKGKLQTANPFGFLSSSQLRKIIELICFGHDPCTAKQVFNYTDLFFEFLTGVGMTEITGLCMLVHTCVWD